MKIIGIETAAHWVPASSDPKSDADELRDMMS